MPSCNKLSQSQQLPQPNGRENKKTQHKAGFRVLWLDARINDPDGSRTRVTAVKGQCPRPLDDGAAFLLAMP